MPTKGKKWRIAWRINGSAADKAYRFANYAWIYYRDVCSGEKIINPVFVHRKLVATSSRIDFHVVLHDILYEVRDRSVIKRRLHGNSQDPAARRKKEKKKFITSFDGAPGFVYSLLDRQTSRRSN